MKKRQFSIILFISSAAMCVGLTLMCIRSSWIDDFYTYYSGIPTVPRPELYSVVRFYPKVWGVESIQGRLTIGYRVDNCPQRVSKFSSRKSFGWPGPLFSLARNNICLLGFEYHEENGAPMTSSYKGFNGQGNIITHRGVAVPYWFLILLSGGFAWWCYRQRPKPGHCNSCDYNLTGNISGVCPECGSQITSSESGAPIKASD